MATKEQLTYTDVRNAASQADALEAVDNYMKVQQRRRTGYTTPKADPSEKWREGTTYTDEKGEVRKAIYRMDVDGNVIETKNVSLGPGKKPSADPKKRVYSTGGARDILEAYATAQGTGFDRKTDPYFKDFTSMIDASEPLTGQQQQDMLGDIVSGIQTSPGFGYKAPSSTDPDVTYGDIKSRFEVLEPTLNPAQIAFMKEKMEAIQPLKTENPSAFKQEVNELHKQLSAFDFKTPSKDTARVYSVKGVNSILNTYTTAAGLTGKDPSVVRYNARLKAIGEMPESPEKQAALRDAESDVLKDSKFDHKDPKATAKFTVAGVQEVINSVTNPKDKANLQMKYNKVAKMSDGKSKQTRLSQLVGEVGVIEKVVSDDKNKETLQKYRTTASQMHHQARFYNDKSEDPKLTDLERGKAKETSLAYYMADVKTKLLRDSHQDKIEYKGQVVMAGRPESVKVDKLIGSKLMADWKATGVGIQISAGINELHKAIEAGTVSQEDANAQIAKYDIDVKKSIYDYAQEIQPHEPQKYYYDLYIANEPDDSYWEYGYARSLSMFEQLEQMQQAKSGN